jgi:hypothetical protein
LANDQAPSIDPGGDRFPPLLTETLDQMLQRDPQQRPGSAAEVAERLEPLIEGCDLTKLVKQAFDVAPLQFKSIDSLDEDLLPGWKSPPLAEAEAEYDNEASDNPEAQSARQPDGHRRRFRRWPTIATAMMGLMSLVALGVVLTLRSAEGEIRIESELDNVTVQIVDETQRSETLAVEQGQTATTVRTGRYRIQLESPTDGVEITPSLVTVKRNEAVVARIIKVNETGEAAATQSTAPKSPRSSKRRRSRTNPISSSSNSCSSS